MTEQQAEVAACVHGCMTGCGRPYDIIVIQAIDGSVLFYCIPCHQQFAYQMMRAMVEPDDAEIREVVAGADMSNIALVDPNAVGYIITPFVQAPAEDEFTFDGVSDE